MPEQFMTPAKLRAQKELRDQLEQSLLSLGGVAENRQKSGVGVLDAMLGIGVPQSKTEFDPTSSVFEMGQTQYDMPSGQPGADFLAEKAANDERAAMAAFPNPTDFRAPGGQTTPQPDFGGASLPLGAQVAPTQDPGRMAPLGPMPGPQQEMPRDQFDILGEAALDKEGGDTKRMWQRIAASLAKGGATASSGRTIMDFLQGTKPAAPDMSTYDMLNQMADKSQAADEAKVETAKEAGNPLLKAYNKQFETNFETMDQMREHRQGRAAESKMDLEERRVAVTEETFDFKKKAEEYEATTTAALAERLKSGDLSAAPPEVKKMIFAQRKEWRTNKLTQDTEAALQAALELRTLLATGSSTASRASITKMVKLAGDTGRLSDQDLARFEKRMGIKGFFDRIHQFTYSDLSDEQKTEFLDIADEMSELAIGEIGDSAKTHVQLITELHPELDEETLIRSFLGTDRYKKAKERESEEGIKIWVVDPEKKLPDQEILESKWELYKKNGWQRG